MKTIFYTLAFIFALGASAQSKYQKAMIKGMELMQTDFANAAGHFERIAAAEKENWLPAYYAALIHVNNSWGQHDKPTTTEHLKKAQEYIDLAEVNSTDNPEIMVLQGMVNTAWITYDSSVYGMKLSGPTAAIYEKAHAMAPENPRVVSGRAQWLIGSARYFGKDVAPYCADLEKAIKLFKTESRKDFEPRWGLEGAMEAAAKCQ